MRRWFPALAILVLTLWGAALAALVTGQSSRTACHRAGWAAWATLAAHGAAIAWFGVARPRAAKAALPEWFLVQAMKHRRKGITLAVWGLAMLGLSWWAIRSEEVSNGWPDKAVWFGTTFGMGFQPGVLVAEWLAIGALTRLIRFGPVWKAAESGAGAEL